MKKSAKLLAALAALALTAVAAFSANPALVRAETESSSERSSFGSVRVTQVKGNDTTPSSEDLSLDVPSFATRGYSSGVVRFDMGVKLADWTGATAMRVTFTSIFDGDYNMPSEGQQYLDRIRRAKHLRFGQCSSQNLPSARGQR